MASLGAETGRERLQAVEESFKSDKSPVVEQGIQGAMHLTVGVKVDTPLPMYCPHPHVIGEKGPPSACMHLGSEGVLPDVEGVLVPLNNLIVREVTAP
jgi:hypothetical protein